MTSFPLGRSKTTSYLIMKSRPKMMSSPPNEPTTVNIRLYSSVPIWKVITSVNPYVSMLQLLAAVRLYVIGARLSMSPPSSWNIFRVMTLGPAPLSTRAVMCFPRTLMWVFALWLRSYVLSSVSCSSCSSPLTLCTISMTCGTQMSSPRTILYGKFPVLATYTGAYMWNPSMTRVATYGPCMPYCFPWTSLMQRCFFRLDLEDAR